LHHKFVEPVHLLSFLFVSSFLDCFLSDLLSWIVWFVGMFNSVLSLIKIMALRLVEARWAFNFVFFIWHTIPYDSWSEIKSIQYWTVTGSMLSRWATSVMLPCVRSINSLICNTNSLVFILPTDTCFHCVARLLTTFATAYHS
jgi:hypothetical protein